MAPVIRAVKLDTAPRRLAHRLALGPAGKPLSGVVGSVSAVAPAAPTPVIDPALQRAWQQRMQSELDAARARVEEEGRAAGHAKGLAQARDESGSQREALASLIAALTQAVDAQIDGLEDTAIAIAFEATLKLLGNRLATTDGVRASVQQVLQRVRSNEKARVRLSPADHALLVQQAESGGIDAARFELASDATIVLGGCIVETRAGRIDGSLETQLARLADTLLAARRAAARDTEVR
jgi:flagellar assembly protein FliH